MKVDNVIRKCLGKNSIYNQARICPRCKTKNLYTEENGQHVCADCGYTDSSGRISAPGL